MNQLETFLKNSISAALQARAEIMKIYNSDFDVQYKQDKSPLRKADQASHLSIVNILAPSQIPILSEEGKEVPYQERKDWKHVWIVDPLDGTKEFVKKMVNLL